MSKSKLYTFEISVDFGKHKNYNQRIRVNKCDATPEIFRTLSDEIIFDSCTQARESLLEKGCHCDSIELIEHYTNGPK